MTTQTRKIAILLSGGIALALVGCKREPAHADRPKETRAAQHTIAVIPKGTQHVFWRSVETGAKQAGQDLGVTILWKGPLQEDDRAGQIQLVQQFVTQKVDAIALAPLDSKALVNPVRGAAVKGVAVAIFDSALDSEPGKDFVSYVATDNRAGGRIAGEEMIKLLDGKGKIVILRYAVGSASTTDREEGFLEIVHQHPNVQVLVENRYAGASAGEAKSAALNLLDQIRQANGVFCPNESSTLGMLLALRQAELAGSVRFIGFDASPALVEGLKQGQIAALVVQNPRKMGYEVVRVLADHLAGKPIERSVDTGATLITVDKLGDPQIQALIQ